jgi:HSP20 family protein
MAEEPRDLQVQETEKRELETGSAERTRDRPAFVPRVDIYETDEAIFVVADMPGVDENTVDITLENNVLTLNGYVEPTQFEGYSLAYAEYRAGDYQRAFTLSNQIDREWIEATVKDGVLRLHLPKVVQARTKKIAIKAG